MASVIESHSKLLNFRFAIRSLTLKSLNNARREADLAPITCRWASWPRSATCSGFMNQYLEVISSTIVVVKRGTGRCVPIVMIRIGIGIAIALCNFWLLLISFTLLSLIYFSFIFKPFQILWHFKILGNSNLCPSEPSEPSEPAPVLSTNGERSTLCESRRKEAIRTCNSNKIEHKLRQIGASSVLSFDG